MRMEARKKPVLKFPQTSSKVKSPLGAIIGCISIMVREANILNTFSTFPVKSG